MPYTPAAAPLIKWPGGKTSELAHLWPLVPPFERYVEPFLGGGALFFALSPQRAIVNDACTELVEFYQLVKRASSPFRTEMGRYVSAWERLSDYPRKFGAEITRSYRRLRCGELGVEASRAQIATLLREKMVQYDGVFDASFCVDRNELLEAIETSLFSKLNRMRLYVDTEGRFSDAEVRKNIETAFRGGFYLHFRNIMNAERRGEISLSREKMVANYYFVREFCYGAMFRFNSRGDFNIPYGGIAYNRKDLGRKVAALFSPQVRSLLNRGQIENLDFEEFLRRYPPEEGDFMFVDPPYDSEFSSYQKMPFTAIDQERLAQALLETPARFLLVIKNTPLVRRIYSDETLHVRSFEKAYLYNVRGRNVRETEHLLISNYLPVVSAVQSVESQAQLPLQFAEGP